MVSCSKPQRRPYASSPVIPSTWVLRLGFSPCSILGVRTCSITHTCIVWLLAAVSLRMGPSGSPAEMDSSCRDGFFLPVRVLSRLFRRLFLEKLVNAFDAGNLEFFSSLELLRDSSSFLDYLAPLREAEWVVYAKRPFAGPEQVLDYVPRYTHRVAISNNRLLDIAEGKVTFRYKDYRHEAQQKTMTLEAEEFIRRFLLHVLPEGFQRIRYYGFLANRYREQKLARCRELLGMPAPEPAASETSKDYSERYEELTGFSLWECPVCHQGRMLVIQIFAAKPTQASNADQGYLVMEKTASGSRPSRAAQAWPHQATGAALPNGSPLRKSDARGSFLPTYYRSLQIPRSHEASHPLITSGSIGSSAEIQLTINTHRLPPGQRFSPTHF
jgi:Putative transposase